MKHGSYLQGMETVLHALQAYPPESYTDPTYKEWKPWESYTNQVNQQLDTDPTYKEWKLKLHAQRPQPYRLSTRILPTRNGNRMALSAINVEW